MQSRSNVSRETEDRIAAFCEMVEQWNNSINLIAPATVLQIAERHVKDSAQLTEFFPPDARSWLDLGSGGGFPGIVVAAYLAADAPNCRVTLVESDRRKAVFLRQAIQRLSLHVNVIADRIESAPGQNADVVSARALAPLPRLIELSMRHLRPGGICVFPKGKNCDAEISDALRAGWSFSAETHKSKTDPNGVILILRNIARDASN
jgi:16S rRNA (guanine527-N7)-methyltransferase